jgi:hypothetical protein
MKQVKQNLKRLMYGALILTGMAAHPALAADVGMAAVAKNAQVNSGGAWKPLRPLQRLEAGDKVKVNPGGQAVVVVFANGNRFVVSSGQATVTATGVQGGKSLGGLDGPNARIASRLTDRRTGANLSRKVGAANPMTIDPNSTLSQGWLPAGQSTFTWDKIVLSRDMVGTPTYAPQYSFTLFDQSDNMLWNVRTSENQATYPEDLPALYPSVEFGSDGKSIRKFYVYRLVPLSSNNRPLEGDKWGVITILNAQDAAQWQSEVAPLVASLNEQIAKTPSDVTLRLLRAEVYRNNGLYQLALQEFEDENFSPAEVELTKQEMLREVSRYALALGTAAADVNSTNSRP